jgi:hypothetical protein
MSTILHPFVQFDVEIDLNFIYYHRNQARKYGTLREKRSFTTVVDQV